MISTSTGEVQGKNGNADGGAGVLACLTEDFAEQFGCAVNDGRLSGEVHLTDATKPTTFTTRYAVRVVMTDLTAARALSRLIPRTSSYSRGSKPSAPGRTPYRFRAGALNEGRWPEVVHRRSRT